MGKWTGAALWSKKEASAGERLPYRGFVDENVIQLRDGSLMMALLVPGLSFETADADELNAHTATREVLLRSALDARFVLYHHVIRRRVNLSLEGTFDDPLAAHIDDLWRDRLSRGALFVNDQFITLVRRPARGKAGWAERFGKLMKRRSEEQAGPAELRALRTTASGMLAALAPYGARLLGDYDGAAGPCNELLELLSALYNGEMRPVRRPTEGVDLGAMLPYQRLNFGLDALELRGAGKANFGALLSLKDYPDSTSPGLTDGLLRLPFEMVLTETYAPADRQIARERIDLAMRRLRSADEEAMAERREMQAARDALGVGAVGFGDHHLSVLVRSDRLDLLDEATAACAAALADTGAVAVREDVNLEPGFWGMFPGNEAYLVRRAMISSANMACFGALHGFAMGQASGNHWGDAVTLLQTTSATPFFFNFHQGDLGNFTVIGPSGSGKTVVMNFLAAQAQKFSPRTILFDKDRGAEVFVRGIGGTYSRVAAGHPTGFNPLALPDTPSNRAFLRDWLGVLLAATGPEELAIIAAAVDAAYANDPDLRRLSHFRELLAGSRRPQPGDLASRLDAWIGTGEHSWLDALDSRIATALVEQTATMVFMPNARARAEDYCDGFSLTAHELEVIRTLPVHSHCFLVRQADASVVVRLDLSGMPEVLTVLSGRESTVRRLDALRAQYGDAPEAWYPALTGELWPGHGGEDDGSALWDEAAQ